MEVISALEKKEYRGRGGGFDAEQNVKASLKK